MESPRIQTIDISQAPERGLLRGGVLPAVSAVVVSAAVFIGALAGAGSTSVTAETVVQTVPVQATATKVSDIAAATFEDATNQMTVAGAIRTGSSVRPALRISQGRNLSAVSEVARAPLADDSVSASFGYSVRRAFSFVNWAGESMSARATSDMLVTMFGANSVCLNGADASCELRSGARTLVDQFNEQIVNGRCEGMVAMAGFALESGRDLSSLTADEAGADIAYWSLTQVAPRVVARAEETARLQPSRIVDSLINQIRAGRTVTLMMSVDGFSHSVLPISVTRANGIAHIDVYDPNMPGEIRVVSVDVAREIWSYDGVLDAKGNATQVSVHGAGRLGFVENSLRTGIHRARFAL